MRYLDITRTTFMIPMRQPAALIGPVARIYVSSARLRAYHGYMTLATRLPALQLETSGQNDPSREGRLLR